MKRNRKIIVVGGVAGGASAATRIRRLDENAQILVFERGPHVSFSNCALPYYLSGTITNSDQLIMMNPEKFKQQYNIDVYTEREVLSIDRLEKKVVVKKVNDGSTYSETYDLLILSPGATPVIPASISGTERPQVFSVRNVVDISRLKQYIEAGDVKNIAVIGGGFIGLEVAENLRHAGKNVTLVEAADQIMASFDYDMVQMLHKEIVDNGINLVLSDCLKEVTADKIILASGKKVAAETVVLSIGVAPETSLANKAGLEIGTTGGIKVNHHYQTSDPYIYAVGDAVEVYHRLTKKPTRLALAGPAQRQARAAADHIHGSNHNNRGVIGSCAVRVFGLNAAATGLNEKSAKVEGIAHDCVYIAPSDIPGMMPKANPLHFKLLYEVPTGRILGAQAIGKGNVDKRIDVIASMIHMGADLEDLKELELCYSPVFGTAKDIVNSAALVALNLLYGKSRQVPVSEVRHLVNSGAYIIDVREANEFNAGHLISAVNIPLSQLRDRMNEIPADRPVYVHCRTSQRSYNALTVLKNSGFDNIWNISGSFLGISLYEYFNDVTQARKSIVTAYNFT